MEAAATFAAKLSDLQPSQLYVSADKLACIERALTGEQPPAIEPLPLKRLGPRTVLTDGHTRALAAFRAGCRSVPVYWETDELDWEAYEICVHWCLQAGIYSVADLQARVVTAEQYEELWYERCRAMHRWLAEQRRSGTRSNDEPGG
jgi:hypothetical protein